MLLKLLRFQRDVALESMKTTVRLVGAVFGIPAVAVPFLTTLFSTETTGATKHPFLSEEWIEAARKIREEYRDRPTQTPPPIRINHVVTGVPFGDGTIEAHTDTTKGDLEMDLGHLDGPDLTVTLPYDTAKKILVDADMQAAMQAFMSGQISVVGDMSKLMALQTAQVDPIALEAGARIREITS